MAGSDAFTRDPEVCDACLGRDYAYRRHFSYVEGLCLLLALPVAMVGVVVLARRGFAPVRGSPLLSALVTAAAATLVVAAVIRAAIEVRARLATRHAPAGSVEEQAADAERFYWLAVWASLTNRPRYRRRMLQHARRMGFDDRRRLAERGLDR